MNKIFDEIKKIESKIPGKHHSSDEPKYEDINAEESKAAEISSKTKDFLSNFKRHKSPAGRPSRFSKIKPRYILIIFIAICAVLIVGSSYAPNVFKPFNAFASVLIVPSQKGINSIGLWFSDKIELTKKVADLTLENSELKKKIADLEYSNSMLRNQSFELTRLQDLLELKEEYKEYDSIAASIISKDSTKWFSTFVINKGSKDGIKKDMNVLAGGGLCGIVTRVGYNYAEVRTIIDDDSAVSAEFQDTKDMCIVHGKLTLFEQNLLEFSDVDLSVDIKNDQAVVTSRVSSKFLPGILIGYVEQYITDANELTKSGYITPVVDFTNLTEVLVITELKEDFIDEDPDAKETEEITTAAVNEDETVEEDTVTEAADEAADEEDQAVEQQEEAVIEE